MSHMHNVVDTDEIIIIDSKSRIITNHTPNKIIMQGDHGSEIITFQMNRYVDGHDMSLCNSIGIHYVNGSGSERVNGIYVVNDLTIPPDDENIVIFTWVISKKATSNSGDLQFSIKFACVLDGETEYSWSTAVCKHLYIQPNIDNSEYPDATDYDEIASYESLRTELMSTAGKKTDGGEIFNDYGNNQAFSPYSHAQGYGTIAAGDYQHVQGKFNLEDKNGDFAHIVGNGTSDSKRSNAHTLTWKGKAWYAEDVVAGDVSLQGLNKNLGDIETALDNIIAIQNSLMGGDA